MSTAEHRKLLAHLAASWPEDLRIEVAADRESPVPTGHALAREIDALARGSWASLPFFSGNGLAWITVAPSADQLQVAIGLLRAWIVPSYGWQDEDHPLVLPRESNGRLGPLLVAVSPSGYFRWWTKRDQFGRVVKKLLAMRRLEDARPDHPFLAVPSLVELRQEYDVALLVGDRETAESAVERIDAHQLDTAVNTRFMRLHLLDSFRDYERIVEDPALADLLQLRMPAEVRLGVARAFHVVYLSTKEERGRLEEAIAAYTDWVHPRLAGLIAACRPSEGHEAARLLAYRARVRGELDEAARGLADSVDDVVRALLAPLSTPPAPRAPVDELFEAIRREDWLRIQELGQQFLEGGRWIASDVPPASVLAVLRESLRFRANVSLAESLERATPSPRAADGRATAPPQTWVAFFASLKAGDWAAANDFLNAENLPSASSADPLQALALVELLEETVTEPRLASEDDGAVLLRRSLVPFIKDFVVDRDFPRADFVPVYRRLLEVWAEQMTGSASPPHGHLLLVLASAVLELSGSDETRVVDVIRRWWQVRRVQAALPYLLSALSVLSDFAKSSHVCEGLWIEGAELVRRDPTILTPAERGLWRLVGSRLGLDASTIDEFLALDAETEAQAVDPMAQSGLRKIAIVSLREKAMRAASDLLGPRTDATIVKVAEEHPGVGTASAVTADVILFVWLANTHAVFRAFDKVRDKLVYVQGTSAESIVLALERWLKRAAKEAADT